MFRIKRRSALALLAASMIAPTSAQAGVVLIPGFEITTEVTGFFRPVDVTFGPDGRMFVAEQRGVVWVVENGSTFSEPFIDLRDEVNATWDRGLLGIAIDPDFSVNRQVYLLYTVDPVFGDPDEPPNIGTFCRLTRYTGTAESNGNEADPSSRLVLIGAVPSEGIPTCEFSHTIGSLRFGADGSLLVSAGDGASFAGLDDGGRDPECFVEGMFPASEDIGAFRAQSLDSMAGKILRVDAATGLGLDTNPYFTGNAADNRSRVWAYGVRNPCRFAVRPGTGGPKPPHPGTLYIGDVGWYTFEELNVSHGGENFGWPCKEGLFDTPEYIPDANPAQNGCDTIETPDSPGPLTDPLVTWDHENPSLSSPPGFISRAPAGVVFYTGACYPAYWQGICFVVDYFYDRITALEVDESDQLVVAGVFANGLNEPVDLAVHPLTGDIYYVSLSGGIFRISYQVEDGDLDADCTVSVTDLLTLLAAWGPCPEPCESPCLGDITGDCVIDVSDLLAMLANWG